MDVRETALELWQQSVDFSPFRLDARKVIAEHDESHKGKPVLGAAERILDYGALWIRSDGTNIVNIARQGQAAPGTGTGTFTTFSTANAMNAAGQVAIQGNLTGAIDGGASGVHFHDILARLGLAEAMKGKLRPYPSGGAADMEG